MTAVLLLNLSYEPFQIVSPRKAIHLMLRGSAERVSGTAAQFRTPTSVFEVPSVLRLRRYINIYRLAQKPSSAVRWSRRAVFRRDKHTCIYCGLQPGEIHANGHRCAPTDFTLEHIIPRCRFTRETLANTWENTACACRWCNEHKGNRTPREAGMRLLWQPYRPQPTALSGKLAVPKQVPEDWLKYLK